MDFQQPFHVGFTGTRNGMTPKQAARISILADALEEAGCDNEDVLRHLRSQDDAKCDNFYCDKQRLCTNGMLYTGMDGMKWIPCNKCNRTGFLQATRPHYRGCWAIDLLLGKE